MNKAQKKCFVCSNNKFDKIYSNLVRCQKCGLIMAETIPNEREINKMYQKEYFFGKEYFDYKADRPALEKNFKKRIKSLDDSLHHDAHVVEVGSAYGYFLNLIKDRVDKHVGFEIGDDGVKYSRNKLGVNALREDFTKHKFAKNDIDLVVMWDVIEHLIEPEKFVKKAAQILKKGGKFVLTTGDIDMPVPRLRKSKWRMIHPPTHIYYFNKNNISQLLERYGLEVISVHYHSTHRNIGSVANQLIINRKSTGKSAKAHLIAYKLAKATKATKLNVPLNTFDIMEVTAVKK